MRILSNNKKGETKMFQKQKETILSLVKAMYTNKNFTTNYLLPYIDFFDSTDDFTEFHCERLEGKKSYYSLIEQLLKEDENAQVFAEVYGLEEDENNVWIYGETLIIFSKLSLIKVEEIFNQSDEFFPDEIGEVVDFNERYILIDKNGNQSLASNLRKDNISVYFCWWD